jgi:hypothetical protein
MPVGSGRLIVSSAIDGWRSRAGAALGFSAFWRSVAAAAADATPPVVDVQVTGRLVRPGQAMDVRVEVFTDTEPTAAVRDTGGVMSPVRLWRPVSGAAGSTRRWEGAIRAPEMPGRYRIEVATAADATGIAEFLVVDSDPVGGNSLQPLTPQNNLASAAASAHRGAVIAAAELATLPARIAAVVEPMQIPVTRHPMRWAWWLVPFAVCASSEWWLRRRRGER